MSTLFVFLSLATLATYVALTAILTGLPPSLSNTFYQLEAKGRNWGYLFTLLCYIVGISVMAAMLEACEGRWFQFIAFFAGGALCFTGTAPRFKAEEHRIHCISAAVCAGATVIWIALMGLVWVPCMWFGFFGAVGVWNRSRLTFWLEMAAFAAAYHALLILY
jgi:hypothetical protein